MSALEQFSTRLVAQERRHLFWRDLVAETFPGMTVDAPVGIRADLARWQLGRLAVARAQSPQARVERGSNGGDRNLVLHLQRHGRLLLRQSGRTTIASQGDIVIADDHAPYSIDISNANDCLIVRIPHDLLQPFCDDQCLYAHLLPGRDPQVALLRRMIEGLWVEREALDRVDERIDEVIASLTRMAISKTPAHRDHGEVDATSDHVRAMIDHVDAHLGDPGLCTASIALAVGLSPRAVQKCFAGLIGSTPTAYISRKRLELAARLLDQRHDMSVTEVAFATGFNDSAFFSRCFRRLHDVSPSQWRERSIV